MKKLRDWIADESNNRVIMTVLAVIAGGWGIYVYVDTNQATEIQQKANEEIAALKAEKEQRQSSEMSEKLSAAQQADKWQTVGFWNYDEIDGQHLGQGMILRANTDNRADRKWGAYLELKNHDKLPVRERTLWPVQINTSTKKVCANYPGYPSYQVHVDMPGEDDDGIYFVEECRGPW